MKKFLSIFAVAALALAAAVSCSDKEDEETTVDLKAISLSSPSLDLFVGDESTLTVKYTPENATKKPAATWTSSNESVASVSEGKVTALAAGEATITATVEKFTATCTVKVTAKDDYTGPVEGNSAWSVVGTLLESDWTGGAHGDYVCAEENGAFVLKNVRLAKDDQIKFRKDKAWTENRGINEPDKAAELAAATPAKAVPNGGNIIIPEAGIYDLYYFAEKEAIVYVTKDATLPEIPDFSEQEPEGIIKIDGEFADWDGIQGLSNGSHGMFKIALDDNYVYFYTWRTREGRFADLWGEAKGYVYFGFELDGDPTTGEKLNNNGPYDFVGFIYCFGGDPENPVIEITAKGNCAPSSYTIDNVKVSGKVDENGAYLEYSIPRSDIPALPEKFAVTSWGNKDLDKVTVSYPFEYPEPQVDWDYTPSAEYTADNNLWKAIDPTMNVSWFYNPEWAAEQAGPEVTFKESTYSFWNKINTTGDWQAQLWLEPARDLILNAEKKYSFSCKVYATEETPVFIKMYHRGEDGSKSFEIARTRIAKGVITEFKAEDFTPLISSQSLLIDFGGVPANTKVFIKDIVLTEGDAVTPPQPMDWDYTPGAAYLADNNLWKKAAGHEGYYYYHCTGADWNGTDTISSEVPFMTTNQSTYELTYEDATANPWQNQLFIFPDTGYEVALAADKTYKLTMTVAANADMNGFFKLSKFDPNNATKREGATIWEKGNVSMKAKEIFTVESPELTGVECDNILIVTDFGGNPAGAKVFIKDITLVEVGAEPQAPATIAEIIKNIPESATGNSTAVEFEANLTSPAVVSYVNGKNAYIQDETGAILLYATDHGLVAGDTIKGKIAIKAYWYNGIPETVVLLGDACEIAHGDAPAPKEITIAQLLDNYDANLLRYVVIKDVTVTGSIADGDRNGEIAQGDNKIAVYAQINNGGLVLTEGDKGDLVTIPAYYKTNKQVYLWDNAWFTKKTPVGNSGEDLDDPTDVDPWK